MAQTTDNDAKEPIGTTDETNAPVEDAALEAAPADAAAETAPEPKPEPEPEPAPKPVATSDRIRVRKPKTTVQPTSGNKESEFGQVRKSVLFLGLVLIAYIIWLVLSGQVDEFMTAMRGVDTTWVLRGALCFCCYYVLGVLGYVVPVAADRKAPLGFRDLMSIEAAGIFFSFLTPGGTGAAPAQIYRFTRAGLSVGAASALQYTRFIIYEFAEGLFAAIMLIFRYNYFVEQIGNFAVIGLILFGVKVIELVGLLIICLSPGFVRRIGNWGIDFAKKRGWGGNYDHWHNVINKQVQEFSDGFKNAARDLPMMSLALAVSMAQLGCLYALPWFVAHAFGFEPSLITCLAAGSMLELLTSAVPLPGGEIGAETGFAMLFGPIFGATIPAAYVIWRVVEYVGPIVAMIPLLGLRSGGGLNVYQQVRRFGHALTRFREGLPGARRTTASEGGIKVDPRKLRRRNGSTQTPSNK